MKKITTWYKFNKEFHDYDFNHIEDGHSELAAPVPKCEHQKKKWANARWVKVHDYLDKDNVIV